MYTAFEITIEDVQHVLEGMNRPHDEDEAARVFGLLDRMAVESSALHGNGMDEQTEYAYSEIERQISERDPAPVVPSMS